jgi:mevalonate kinase
VSAAGAPVPAHGLPMRARAPGKCILFGEHAVVHGGPELVAAIDRSLEVVARAADRDSLHGDPKAFEANPYLRAARTLGGPRHLPIDLALRSSLPASAGLGSSAALCAVVATIDAALQGGCDRAELAHRAFAIERAAQGVGSAGDTSCAVAGGLIAINADHGETIWTITSGEQRWDVRPVADPGWRWLVVDSGVPRRTADAVRSVGRRLAERDGREILDHFRAVTLEGIDAVGRRDPVATGRCLDENHALLQSVGVSHPRLESLLEAVRPFSYGAKLTGAGAGGSIVALPRPDEVDDALARSRAAGGSPYIVRVHARGAELVPDPSAP